LFLGRAKKERKENRLKKEPETNVVTRGSWDENVRRVPRSTDRGVNRKSN